MVCIEKMQGISEPSAWDLTWYWPEKSKEQRKIKREELYIFDLSNEQKSNEYKSNDYELNEKYSIKS